MHPFRAAMIPDLLRCGIPKIIPHDATKALTLWWRGAMVALSEEMTT
jgi:hypothetical protein